MIKIKGKYGYIELKATNDDGWDDQVEPEVRKTTAVEREEIILNAIRTHSGKSFLIWKMAKLLGVSERTVQKTLRSLETQGLISITPRKNKNGKQLGNVYTYLGTETELPEGALTIELLYNLDNPAGFRDWDWEDFKFIPGYFDEDFTKFDSMNQRAELKARKKMIAEKQLKYPRKKPK